MTPTRYPSATVTVLTYNGEQLLDQLLTAVEAQDYPGEFDVLVIDSGSTDSTLQIVAAHPQVRLHEIPNSEFQHGGTRNLAAQLSTGEIVVYLTHDAVPASDDWLTWLVHPMADDERIAAVVGKQLPRPGCPPILKYDIQRVFERLGPDYAVSVVADDGSIRDEDRSAAKFYSDANSAARRSVLTGPVPYPAVSYAEDQAFAEALLAAGFRKAYAPRGAVLHSNELTLRTLGPRITEEVIGLRRIGTVIPPLSVLGALKQAVKWSAVDAAWILVDRELTAAGKLGWLFANPWFHRAKWFGFRRGSRAPIG
jgi:rhamnosyltransferase